ncbi:conserved hypothetical protein [Bradyrhizobium oligotrophicum S58]|uniref:Uncharacterized protein n=1 Tax=Bradyrhizobium oligotrophicum S58 TaxID=1245469 RepID=M4Z5K9_9BRAD|nr:hypothetical protein [Bradyrhizobium oligotrophicum]BAM88377.1 conserved hypothetical protein [Bradyrhizobium oligotrophicum S58]
MSNIIPFRSRTVPAQAAFTTAHAETAVAGVGRLGAARPEAPAVREDVRKTVLLLDLALQHARELSDFVADARARRTYDRHLASIEYSLQIARDRMAAL